VRAFYHAPTDPLARFKGPTCKGREWRKVKGGGRGEGRGIEGKREGRIITTLFFLHFEPWVQDG